jgi:hypothetical protein
MTVDDDAVRVDDERNDRTLNEGTHFLVLPAIRRRECSDPV